MFLTGFYKKFIKQFFVLNIFLFLFSTAGCPGKNEDPPFWLLFMGGSSGNSACLTGLGTGSITVTWTASRSFDANTAAGGGHKIYYNTSTKITKTTPYVIDVPNSVSPTTYQIGGLVSGCTYYVKVGAYSALNPDGGELSAVSSPITVP